MANNNLRKRNAESVPKSKSSIDPNTISPVQDAHPAGEVKHGPLVQVIRLMLFLSWLLGCIINICVTQIVGAPLYFWRKDYFYTYMALTKQSFGIVLTAGTRLFSPTKIRVSWHASMNGQLRRTEDGRLETKFPERLILMTNHQIYTDWVYLWWAAYTSRMHGHIFIILKESLKYVPIIGTGMMFYGFVFMARKWDSDKPRLQHRLKKLKTRHGGPMSGSTSLDPMWLLIFPEGTNLSANTRKKSLSWSQKQGVPDRQNLLLPRTTGLLYCLQELKDTVEYVYDCTIGYEGIKKEQYAQDIFTIQSTYLQGRPPRSVSMYWRRYAVSEIPLASVAAFDEWLNDRWKEKDALLEKYYETGHFPPVTDSEAAQSGATNGFIETEVKLQTWLEIGQIFVVVASLGLICNVFVKLFSMFS